MNYKEGVEEELLRRAEATGAKEAAEKTPRTLSDWEIRRQGMIDETVAIFDSIGVPEHLAEINKGIWQNKGKVRIESCDGYHPERTITLSAEAPSVKMEGFPEYRWTFGQHEVGDPYTDQGGNAAGSRWELGFYRKLVGHRITGYDIKQIHHFLSVKLDFSNTSIEMGSGSLIVKDSHPVDITTLEDKLELVDLGWKHSSNRWRYQNRAAAIYSDGETLGVGFALSDKPIPERMRKMESMINRIIEVGLLASCIARTLNPIKIAEAEAQTEIARITPLIGKRF